MDENPYAPPKAVVHAQAHTDKALRMAELHITQAWIGACIAAALAALMLLHSLRQGLLPGPLLLFMGAGVLILLALAFGVYRKSRVCAVLLLLHQLCGLAVAARLGTLTITVLIALVFCYLFAQGAFGCFRYQRLKDLPRT